MEEMDAAHAVSATGRENAPLDPQPAPRMLGNWCWCSCGLCKAMPTKVECSCCNDWELLAAQLEKMADHQDDPRTTCITHHKDFPALLNPAVLETFFHIPKINWKRQPAHQAPDGELTVELVGYRIVLEWILPDEKLRRGNRQVLPSFIILAIRERYPSPTGQYVGFKEAEEADNLMYGGRHLKDYIDVPC
ncbi:hypothetical protein SKAU_G00245950 [Synaphobranchus kaupii]|uniref:Uncharacterized protein n=1 Tax=Synaphobranchus kaupii TaxID=118154 RepID=A0A9Q1F263_SYNKA|nr:hypothetical protein SKAU_G00245950 [Synaphobranchus kaupii]